jgi:endonuclease/exonuclease/phosphatase family metal-dependent hydrolase
LFHAGTCTPSIPKAIPHIQEATARHVEVRQQNEQVQQNRKRKFTATTIAKQTMKAEMGIAIKKEGQAGVVVQSHPQMST